MEWKILQEEFPRLYTFAKDKLITVATFLAANDIAQHFQLPMSALAYDEFQTLQGHIQALQQIQTPANKDVWHYQ